MLGHHEESRTVRIGRYWYNVNGHTGDILAPIWSFELPRYNTMGAAVRAARRRSMTEGRAQNTKYFDIGPGSGYRRG